jgi:hypothetical protein
MHFHGSAKQKGTSQNDQSNKTLSQNNAIAWPCQWKFTALKIRI